MRRDAGSAQFLGAVGDDPLCRSAFIESSTCSWPVAPMRETWTHSPGGRAMAVAGYLQYEFMVAIQESAVAGFAVWRRVAQDEAELLNLIVAAMPPAGGGGAH